MSHSEDVSQKFDKFIRDFDDELNKDTSTIKTINNSRSLSVNSSPQTDTHSTTESSPIKSPLISTPTKPNRNSISLDNQPLKDQDPSLTPTSRVQRLNTPRSVDAGLKRSGTINRSLPKKGLNLNLNINKQTNTSTSTLKVSSPNTPVFTKDETTTSSHSQEHRRRRTNSSLSSTQSVIEPPKNEDFNDSLRLLALKEMKIIELKDELKLLQQKIESEEADLQKLKLKIGNDFKKSMSPVQKSTNNQSPPKINPGMNGLSSDVKQTNNKPNAPPSTSETPPADNKNTSMWAKPISFLNQFDQILQNEIEKLNKEAFPQNYKPPSSSTKQSPERYRSPQRGTTHPEGRRSTSQDTQSSDQQPSSSYYRNEDVLNTVSNSLWSFVSEVKHGILGDDEPSPETTPGQRRLSNQSNSRTSKPRTKRENDAKQSDEEANSEQEMITIRG